MKIAITCQDDNENSMIDQRFGRGKYFLIADIENNEVVKTKAVLNEGAAQGHGAGIKAAEQMGELKVEKVLTGQLGPNASAVLDSLGIEAYHASGTAKDAVISFIDNKLNKISETAEPHAGIMNNDKGSREVKEIILFPLLNSDGKNSEISQHFGHAPFFGIYDSDKKELKVVENNLDHTNPGKSPIDQIEEAFNPTAIFAKGIGGRAISLIQQKGLSLKTGDYKTVKEAIQNLDNLEVQTQSCGHKP